MKQHNKWKFMVFYFIFVISINLILHVGLHILVLFIDFYYFLFRRSVGHVSPRIEIMFKGCSQNFFVSFIKYHSDIYRGLKDPRCHTY